MVSSNALHKLHQLLSFLDHYLKQVVKKDYFKWELELGKTRDFLKDPTLILESKELEGEEGEEEEEEDKGRCYM